MAIKLEPENAGLFNDRGSAKRLLEDYDGAINDYNKAIKLDPKMVFAYNNLGSAKRKKR